VEARFGPFGDSANEAWKLFWMHPMEVLGDVAHVESRFSAFMDNVRVRAR
jgi:hypothetical protein